ncbi:ABC transporter substrate-binding protein [Maricurvus nonylphenolicus]|uniref:ABC transporter substrate-binding protein n=1 Tax=Maricurvus nonylphenolicus TaxID=1008307 RepID=UPI0036F41C6B
MIGITLDEPVQLNALLRSFWPPAIVLLYLLCNSSALMANPMHVVFINPGHANLDNPTGHFWPEASRFAHAVAEDLDIQLEILHAERNAFRLQALVQDILKRPQKPDYLLLVNERFALTPIFDAIDKAGIPFFLAYNHYNQTLHLQPKPRQTHKHWLGALVPDNEFAGYQLAKKLITSLKGEPARLLAFSGDDVTSASLLRVKGLKRALQEHPSAKLQYIMPGEWRYDIPQQRTPGLLRRHPDINLIWAANGAMGLGALKGSTQSLRLQKVNIASINWDQDEITALQNGDLYASVGGHFMTAGWSLIMLYDYHHGRDFIDDGGSYQQRKIFEAVTRDNIQDYLPVLQTRQWQQLDYRGMSKTYNPELKNYQFSLGKTLRLGY